MNKKFTNNNIVYDISTPVIDFERTSLILQEIVTIVETIKEGK